MTSPNPMALEAKALEAADTAAVDAVAEVLWTDFHGRMGGPWPGIRNMEYISVAQTVATAKAAIRAYLAALPPPAAGEGLEPVACEHCGGSGYITKWVSDVLAAGDVGYIRREHSDVRCSSCNGTGRATPAARAAVLEDEVAIDRSLLEAACRELRKWKVEKGGDDQIVLNLETALKEKT